MNEKLQRCKALLKALAIPEEARQELLSWLNGCDRTLHALEESETMFRAILETTVEGIITINESGEILSFNPAAERVFGYRKEEVLERNVSLLMPEPDARRHADYMRHYLETGEARIIGRGREVIGKRRDGTLFPLELAVSHVRIGKRNVFAGILRDISERRRAEQAIVSAGETERKLIGQELHDALGQKLTGLTLLAKTLEKKLGACCKEYQQDAGNINTLAREAVRETKRLAQGLYPSVLEKHGLSIALEQLVDAQRHLFQAPCVYAGEPDLRIPDKSVELHLYRIAQEALSNAVQHARARNIRVQLERTDGEVLLRVSDDGTGFSAPPPKEGGMGLAIMKYRAGMIGATLEIGPGKTRGTCVACTLRLEKGGLS